MLYRLAELDSTNLELVEEPDIFDDENLEFSGPLSRKATIAIASLVFAPVSHSHPIVAPVTLSLDPAELLEAGILNSESLPPAKHATLLTQPPKAFTDSLPDAYASYPLLCHIVKALKDEHLSNYLAFCLVDRVLFMEDAGGWRLVVPQGRTVNKDLGIKSPMF